MPENSDVWWVGTYKVDRGKSLPFGATFVGNGINFALFSEHATAATLLLFDSDNDERPIAEIHLDPKRHRTGHVWHALVEGIDPTVRYGWRLEGPHAPHEGHWYDPNVVLIDPYARALSGGSTWGESDIIHVPSDQDEKVVCHRLGRLPSEDFDWEGDTPPRIPMADLVIYEVHPRGFTVHESSGVKHPGTYLGLIEKIPYLKELGVNAVELMPVFEFDENEHLRHHPRTGEILRNYWGYSPIAFFAPKASYAANGHEGNQVNEFRQMVKAFHAEGMEVYLDVVFNHTGEGDERGPVISFRGIDNSIYYMLEKDGSYRNYSGCGNTLNCNHSLVRAMILDALRYWVSEMHVDGFRFDLAAILGRGENGEVLQNPPLLERISVDPVLADTKMIAEAWDAAGLYQVGSFPSWGRWAEWNGFYRDHVRLFWRGDDGTVGNLASRMCGSEDVYQATGRRPYHSINFITAHDGFTLSDLVSYERKRNEDNGEENRDGENWNNSMNFGVEGPTDDPQVNALRKRMMKNFVATMFLSQGVPMLLHGDEFCRTQRGNNNAYCQDNEIAWIDWSLAERNPDMFRFTRLMIGLRRRHHALRRSHFFGQDKGIRWHGAQLDRPDWSDESHWMAFLLEGGAAPDKPDDDIYVMINGADTSRRFAVPHVGKEWRRVVDTAREPPQDIFGDEIEAPAVGCRVDGYELQPRSLVVLVTK